MHSVGLYCKIILQCTVQKHKIPTFLSFMTTCPSYLTSHMTTCPSYLTSHMTTCPSYLTSHILCSWCNFVKCQKSTQSQGQGNLET